MRHTANSAMCAVLTGTLFAADPRAAQRQGGLHVNVVVDARDGRWGGWGSSTNHSVRH